MGILLLVIAGCGSTDAPSAAPGEPIGQVELEQVEQVHRQASPPEPAARAMAAATALEVPCGPCKATDPLCDCIGGSREVWSPPKPNPSALARAGAAPGPPLAIVPFRIRTKRESLSLVVDVDATGQLALTSGEKSGGARRLGRIEGADIFNSDGERVAQLAADGTLAIADGQELRLDPSNEVFTSAGGRARIADDGTIQAIRPDGKPFSGLSARVEGFKPEMRRTAIVVFVSFFGIR